MLAVKSPTSLHICTDSLELRHSNGMSCAGSTGDVCIFPLNSECCGESVPATTANLRNHQCAVSMRQKCSQYVVIKFLNKTYASLPSKKEW